MCLEQRERNGYKDENLYGTKRIQIPTPQFVIFYNGSQEQPDRKILRLSDAYCVKEEHPALELTAVMLNINRGHNEKLKEMCKSLKDYSEYTARVREYAQVKPVEEAWKRQRQFAADASHELKTPLTVILSNVGLIAASPELTDPEDKRRIGYIQAEAGRMKELVEELLFLARSDAGRLTAEKTHLDLSFLIESCALNFEPVAFDQGKLKAEFRERYPVYRNQSGYAVYKRRAEAGI